MRWLKSLPAALLVLAAAPLQAAPLVVGYLELADDPRYDRGRMESRIPGKPWGRPYVGAGVAVKEARFPLSTVDVELELRRTVLDEPAGLGEALDGLAAGGVRLVMLDLPADLVARAMEAGERNRQLLFNVSATADALRQEACHPRLFHLAPSDSMLMGGLAQHLVSRGWRRVLLVEGPSEADAALAGSFRRAADRYGLDIAEERGFGRGSDPRRREANNLDLLTRGGSFDVIFVADSDGEFARTLPYSTRAPRPVVGSAGLTPVWWHWNWQRHGAPQLNGRFTREAKREMTGYDWSAWIGVKAIAEAVMRTGGSADAGTLAGYLRSDDLVLDGFQGYRLSFREWNNQLRMAVFLASPDWVAARAPFEGFLHPRNDLDSLGYDAAESRCDPGGDG